MRASHDRKVLSTILSTLAVLVAAGAAQAADTLFTAPSFRKGRACSTATSST
jgi:hypothetical protein